MTDSFSCYNRFIMNATMFFITTSEICLGYQNKCLWPCLSSCERCSYWQKSMSTPGLVANSTTLNIRLDGRPRGLEGDAPCPCCLQVDPSVSFEIEIDLTDCPNNSILISIPFFFKKFNNRLDLLNDLRLKDHGQFCTGKIQFCVRLRSPN